MSIFSVDIAKYVIRPTLKMCDLYSVAAEQLLLGTAAVESDMGTYLHQKGGPALGIYQMEPDTHNDIYLNYLNFRPELKKAILLACEYSDRPSHSALMNNLAYATVMARVKYMRVLQKLPDNNDVEGLADYWKAYYNTSKGKGASSHFELAYKKHVAFLYL